jgi:phosphoglycolate phosphatase
MRAKAVLFDKDGTLFDFQKSWSRWIGQEVVQISGGDPVIAAEIAAAVGFDAETGLILPHSPAIAGTEWDVARLFLPFMPGAALEDLVAHLQQTASGLIPVEVTPLVPFLLELAAMDLYLGVATNDSEAAARKHLRHHGVVDMFDYVAGYDSGHGAKPEPGMCTAFAQACGLAPGNVVMVGDSRHDLDAGRAAGMQTVGVLTGVAGENDLRGHADVILPDIRHLGGWLSG